MSRAFVKERDDEPVGVPLLRVRAGPLVLTRRGLCALRERIAATTSPAEREALEAMLLEATPAPPPDDPSRVALGATVTLRGVGASDCNFDIVTEDEVDVENGRLGIGSPLARAILGKRARESARWQRPVGVALVEILRITYD